MSEVITFQIQALDEYTRMPIANAKIQLENINLGQNPKTNSQGLATFEIDSKQNLKSFRAKLIHKDYQEYPILDRLIILNSIRRREKPLELRFKQKLDNFAVKEVKLKLRTYTLTDANNEVITKNFYKVGDTLILKASFDENKVKENEIKWAYKVMSEKEIKNLQQQDSKDKNPYSTQLYPVGLDEIPNDTLQILQDSKTFFSNTPAYTIKNAKSNEAEPKNIYKGKTLEITIPKDFENKNKPIALFAYKNEPNWKVCYIIRVNDYPQITIDCTLAETLRAHTNKDEISRLGWGVSYICQRLWHDNPANAKELGELIYIDSKDDYFIDSIPNETMKKIAKEVLPRITLKEHDRNYSAIAEEYYKKYSAMYLEFETYKKMNNAPKEFKDKTIGLNAIGNIINFYIELDWDRFYMKFPLMKKLEKEISSIDLEPTTYGYQGIPNPIVPTYNGKILTKGFLAQIQNLIENKKEILKNIQKRESMQITTNILEIAKNPKGVKIPKSIYKVFDVKKNRITELQIEYEEVNNKKFSFTKDITNPQKHEKTLKEISPSDLKRSHMQFYGIPDKDFGIEYLLSFNEKSTQAIALYALCGKFQIYYVLDTFEVEKLNENEIAIYPRQIKAYVDDSFDFRDQDHSFNQDGSIKELGQPVGAWDYNEVRFDITTSLSQMSKYTEKEDISTFTAIGAMVATWCKGTTPINIEEYKNYKKQNIYPNYNHEYQQTQKYFNLGCDFLVTNPTFKNIEIPNNLDIEHLFKIIIHYKEVK